MLENNYIGSQTLTSNFNETSDLLVEKSSQRKPLLCILSDQNLKQMFPQHGLHQAV